MNNIKILVLKYRLMLLKRCLKFLSIAGFGFLASCTKDNSDNPIAMYGIIAGEFEYRGLVADQVTHQPVQGITVKIAAGANDTTFASSNSTGNYFAYRNDVYENQQVRLIFVDNDSTLNGEYKSKTVDVVISFRDINNKEHIANIDLEPKE